MQGTCPVCFARFAIEAAFAEPAARRFITTVVELPVRPDLVVRYLGLFRPPKRALAWSRANRLADELAEAMRAGRIRRRGRDWAAPPEAWTEALATVVARRDEGALDLPFRDHAYLWEVLMRAASRSEAAQERAVEEERRDRATRGDGEAKSAIDIALKVAAAAGPSDEERREAYRAGMAGVRKILGTADRADRT